MERISKEQAADLCLPYEVPPAGYMRAVALPDGSKAWLRHLPVTGVLLVCPVASFQSGVGVGAVRKMYS